MISFLFFINKLSSNVTCINAMGLLFYDIDIPAFDALIEFVVTANIMYTYT